MFCLVDTYLFIYLFIYLEALIKQYITNIEQKNKIYNSHITIYSSQQQKGLPVALHWGMIKIPALFAR